MQYNTYKELRDLEIVVDKFHIMNYNTTVRHYVFSDTQF